MDEAKLLLSCVACDWRDVVEPSNVALLLSKCPKCSDMVRISPYAGQTGPPASHEDQYLGPQGEMDLDGIEWADDIVLQDDATISTYVNRVMPLVTIARIIADIERSGGAGDASHMELISKLDEAGVGLRNELELLEERTASETGSELNRGQRASLGFPTDDETSRRRFLRSYVGGDTDSGSLEMAGGDQHGGELQKLGLIRVNADGTINLSDRTRIMMKIDPRPRRDIVEIQAQEGNYPGGAPKWFDGMDSRSLADAIAIASDREMLWMERIMTRIRVSQSDQADLAKAELKRVLAGDTVCCRHWDIEISDARLAEGKPSFVFSEHADEEEKQLERRIYRDLSSTLGRMRELRLILPVKRGRRVRYLVSPDIGMHLLDRWREDLDSRA